MGRMDFGGVMGGALEAGLTTYKTLADVDVQKKRLELEDRNQTRLDQAEAENSQIRQLALRKGLKQESDDAEAAEIAAALQTGDLSSLSANTALAVNKQLEAAGFTADVVMPRLKSATILKPVIDRFEEQSKTWQQQAANGQGLQQTDTVHLATDPNFSTLKPYLKDLLFDHTRFNDQSGSPKLHQYNIGGKQVMGMVDQADPVADLVYHSPSGKVMVGLNIKGIKTDEKGQPVKDASGNYMIDDTVQIPQAIATTGRSNSDDDTISTLTLPELRQKTEAIIEGFQ